MRTLLLALALVWSVPAAASSGWIPKGSDTPAQVTRHRVVVSLLESATIVTTELTFDGTPSDYLWLFPVKGSATISLASEALFQHLDAATRPYVAPPIDCPEGCVPPELPAPPPYDFSEVPLAQPVQTVTVHSANPSALATLIHDNGYTMSEACGAVIDAYIAEGYDFIVVTGHPEATQHVTVPMSITTQGGSASMPLRIAKVGAQLQPMTVWVLASSRMQPAGAVLAEPGFMTYDWQTGESDYYDAVGARFVSGVRWLVQFVGHVDASEPSYAAVGLTADSMVTRVYGEIRNFNDDLAFVADDGGLVQGALIAGHAIDARACDCPDPDPEPQPELSIEPTPEPEAEPEPALEPTLEPAPESETTHKSEDGCNGGPTSIIALVAFLLASAPAHARPRSPRADAVLLPNGLALPYPTLRVFRAFGRCLGKGKKPDHWHYKWKSHDHEGIDLGGLGPDGGLGSAIRSLTKARVTEIARGDDKPAKYGIADRREGDALRKDTSYPRSFAVAGYGDVFFFTRAKGYYRTGNMVVTVGIGGLLDGHEIRYMHLGAPRPDLQVGDVLEPGEEVGVLGGTAVQDSAPHLHLDIRDPNGESVDPAPLIGLVTSAWCGVPRQRSLLDRQAFIAAAGEREWRPESWAPPVGVAGRAGRELPTIDLLRTPPALVKAGIVKKGARFWHELALTMPCQRATFSDDFSTGAYAGHAWTVPLRKGQVVDVSATFGATPASVTLIANDSIVPSPYEAADATDLVVAVLPSGPSGVSYSLVVADRCR